MLVLVLYFALCFWCKFCMLHIVLELAGLTIQVSGPLRDSSKKDRRIGWKNPKSKLRYLEAMPEQLIGVTRSVNIKCVIMGPVVGPGSRSLLWFLPRIPAPILVRFFLVSECLMRRIRRRICYRELNKTWLYFSRKQSHIRFDSIRAFKLLKRNHEDDGNENRTNLHIWQWKTAFLHALQVHFSFLDISQTFSFFQRREMICFAVGRREHMITNVQFCLLMPQALVPDLIPGQLEHIFLAQRLWITDKGLQKREVAFLDDVLASVDVVFA